MPIQRSISLPPITNDAFAAIDRVVMRHAYAIQNEMGRLFDERVYENELALRLRRDGFIVQTQVRITVTHGNFLKDYYLDLVVNGMVCELKVAESIHPRHKAQALHYAMLQDVRLVKVINFGAESVQGELHQNALSTHDRHKPMLRNSGWQLLSDRCEDLLQKLRSLLSDWGTHLDRVLYNDALVHYFGGEDRCLQRVEVRDGGALLGTHQVQMHAPESAFVVTSLFERQEAYERQLRSVFERIPVTGMQWINLNHARVELTTLVK